MRYSDLSIYQTKDILFLEDPILGVQKIYQLMNQNDVLLITGSLHFAGYMKSKEEDIKAAIK
jgi:hypothetical protein